VTPSVSVVVPTYRRPELLDGCLAALVEQALDPREFEVIVADDAASCETRVQVERWSRRSWAEAGPAIRYIPVCGAHGPAAARNRGWQAAQGSVIAFTDDDCLPDAGWLAAGLAAMGPGVDALSGRLVMPLEGTPTDYERNAALLQEAGFVTANCFCRREWLEVLGGFDERFDKAWREDSDLQFRIEAAGGVIVSAAEAVVVHPIRPAGWGVSLRQQSKSQYNALLYKLHPERYRQQIQSGAPWRYYAILAALVVGLGGVLGGRRQLALSGLLGWLGLTGRFCAIRLTGTSHAPSHVVEMAVTSALIPPLSIFWRLRGAVRYRVWFL
jgi:glycosyltransferase involved in cell wall biosynthesis